MKKMVILLVIFWLPACPFGQAEQSAAPSPLVFTHVTVIDGSGAPAQPDMTVVISGGRIADLGRTGKVQLPKSAQLVNGKGQYLIPGLWDMHVHLGKAGENALPLFIANGVTSVRDMGGDFAAVLKWRQEVAEGRRLGPRIKTPGPILESAKNIERMKREGTVEPVDRTRRAVPSPEAAASVIDSIAKLGVDFLKMRTVESLETYRAIGEAARRAGLALVGHADRVPPEEILKAGQRSIEHPLLPPLDKYTSEQRQSLFEKFAANGIVAVPTLVNGEKSLFVANDVAAAIVADHRGALDSRRKYLSGYLIEDWKEQVAERKAAPPFDWNKIIPSLKRDLQEMQRAGVKILPGTDVAVVLIYPGFSLHDELQLLVREIGLTPMEALISATRHPAEFLGLQRSLGTLEKGKIADLVLLEANPLDDISHTQKIAAVVVSGKFLPRPALQELLAQVEAAARQK